MTGHYKIAQDFATGATRGKGSRMFIDGDTIYSYGHHFKIAKRCDGYVLSNSRGYSSSIAKHKSYVLRALHWAGHNIIRIEDCNPENADEQIKENEAKIIKSLIKYANARKSNWKEYRLLKAKELIEQNELICENILNKEYNLDISSFMNEEKLGSKIYNKIVLEAL